MNTTVMPAPQLSNGRLLLLGVSSVILCMSFIMSLFAPFPLALAIILYGRTKGVLVGILGLVLSLVFATTVYGDLTWFVFYACVLIFGLGIGEIVQRSFPPVKSMVVFGLSFMLIVAAALGLFVKSQNTTMEGYILKQLEKNADKISEQKKMIEKSQDKNAIEVLNLLDNPKLMVKGFLEAIPNYFFMGVFLMLWFNMFLVLKSRRLLLSGQDYPYSEANLLHFQVPFSFVFVLILGLVLANGDYFGFGAYEVWGFTIIKCLGLFYFFQGFGVFTDLLSFLGIGGIFRTLIVMVVIFMANYLIAAAGLFDNWFDFRKYFIKRKID